MAKTYRISPAVRISNAIVAALLRRGVKMGGNSLLTVPGRTSGEPRTTPVTLLEWQGERFLQSPFGQVNWVRNLRAAGHATLTRGRQEEPIAVVELGPAEAAQVLKSTLASYPSIIKGYFDVTPDSPLEAFEREAPRHPMFRVITQVGSRRVGENRPPSSVFHPSANSQQPIANSPAYGQGSFRAMRSIYIVLRMPEGAFTGMMRAVGRRMSRRPWCVARSAAQVHCGGRPVDTNTFDALTRRASLMTLGVAGLAGIAGPLEAKAKNKKKGKGDNLKKCKKQVDACRSGIAQLCEVVFAEDAAECIPFFEPCCEFLKNCNAAQAFACAVEAAASLET